MELTHTFTVPVDRATTWSTFQDIAGVAECFPGAVVTSFDGDTFEGTCKVKLGPIALQYGGKGSFVERDEDTGRLVLDARGRDKRGNGTAGATVTATLTEDSPQATTVRVVTDLQITGKPAQFGRGVMQDVSDKLLGQFVTCLESRLGGGGEAAPAEQAAPVGGQTGGEGTEATPSGVLAAESPESPASTPESPESPAPPPGPAPRATSGPVTRPAQSDDALDLGATVLPILLRSYWRQALGVGVVLVVLRWLWRRR